MQRQCKNCEYCSLLLDSYARSHTPIATIITHHQTPPLSSLPSKTSPKTHHSKKTGQALREDAPGIRNEMENEQSSGDEGGTPKRKAAASAAKTQAPVPTNGAYAAVPPAGYAPHGQQGHEHAQQSHQWMHRQHSAPMNSYSSSQRSSSHPYQQNLYNMPTMLYNGVRSTGNKFGKMSQTATEAMRQHYHHPGAPPNQVAFGREFTPTVLSSGSTMSTISGLSGSGIDASGGFHPRMSHTTNPSELGSLRLSQLSEMSKMSFGSSMGLTRSNSLPELGLNKDFTSLSDSSFAALMEEEKVSPGEWATAVSATQKEFRDSTGTSSSSGLRPPAVPVAAPQRTRNTSAVSAMSWASTGSQRSNVSSSVKSASSETSWLNPIRSRLTGSITSDHSFSSSTRYVNGASMEQSHLFCQILRPHKSLCFPLS